MNILKSAEFSNYANLVHKEVKEADELNDREKDQLRDILWKYSDVFNDKPGKLRNYECKIKMKLHTPIFFIKPYGVPFSRRQAVEQELQNMEDWGLIQREESQYNNPLVIISKKTEEARLVLRVQTTQQIYQKGN